MGNQATTISAHRNPNYLSIQFGAKSNKKCCPTKRSAHHIHFDKIMHDIFLVFSEVKNAFLSLHAFSIEGSFNKINKCIFN